MVWPSGKSPGCKTSEQAPVLRCTYVHPSCFCVRKEGGLHLGWSLPWISEECHDTYFTDRKYIFAVIHIVREINNNGCFHAKETDFSVYLRTWLEIKTWSAADICSVKCDRLVAEKSCLFKAVSLSLRTPLPIQPFGLPVACFRFSNLSETKHHEMWLRFSRGDIFSTHKANTAAIIFSGLAPHYFSRVILLQKDVIWKTAVIREHTCQKLSLPLFTPFWCFSVRHVGTWRKRRTAAASIFLDELDICTVLDMGNVVRRGAVIQCGKKWRIQGLVTIWCHV